jgi:hypothetical protein
VQKSQLHFLNLFLILQSMRVSQALAYVYFEDEPGWRAAAKLLSRDEAGRIAATIAKLPELLRRNDRGPRA